MAIKLYNSRLCLVAGQCFFQHRWRKGSEPEPIPWERDDYLWAFNQMQGGNALSGFGLPWRPNQSSTFWSLYLGQALGGISAGSAWNAMVPLRLTSPQQPKVSTNNAAERVFYDVYSYPHGIVAALTIQSPSRSIETLDEWRDRTRRLRLERPFSVVTINAATQSNLNAATALSTILDWHRKEYYGIIGEHCSSNDLISICTIIQGDGVNPTTPIDEDIHRTLHAVTSCPVNWQYALLPELRERCLPMKSVNESAGDALYAVGRNFTLWRPALFNLQNSGGALDRRHTLSCFGHNLLAGAIQAESLCLFARGLCALRMPHRYDADFMRKVAVLLNRMRNGDMTYRSSSIKTLIEDRNIRGAINGLLSSCGIEIIK